MHKPMAAFPTAVKLETKENREIAEDSEGLKNHVRCGGASECRKAKKRVE